jgi:threonine aldolase
LRVAIDLEAMGCEAAWHTGAVIARNDGTTESLPPPPDRDFASDNAAGIHETVLAALVEANIGRALAYGDDPWTRGCEAAMSEVFDTDVVTQLVWGGTGANVMALATLLGPGEAVVCSRWAHIHLDEAAAPERVLGAKLMALDSTDGKLTAGQIHEVADNIGVVHHAQPAVVSLTQPTEMGAVYSFEELRQVVDAAKQYGMKVHLDGARIANATAALGGTRKALRAMTVDAGIDVVSFGITKCGAAYGEAVVYLDPALARRAPYVRKQVTQLPSKMRFVAAQVTALLNDDLWIALGHHANDMAQRLYRSVVDLEGIALEGPPAVNSVYPCLDPGVIERLRAWSPFWPWDPQRHQVRWMAAWDTTVVDVERFAAGVSQALGDGGTAGTYRSV